jgi:hypothetical protein
MSIHIKYFTYSYGQLYVYDNFDFQGYSAITTHWELLLKLLQSLLFICDQCCVLHNTKWDLEYESQICIPLISFVTTGPFLRTRQNTGKLPYYFYNSLQAICTAGNTNS